MSQQSVQELLGTPLDKVIPKHALPTRIESADWQPPFTPNSDQLRVFLNGEPISGAFAASTIEGWVMICGPKIVKRGKGAEYQCQEKTVKRKLEGTVELRPTRW